MPILVWGKKIRSNGSGSTVNPQHLLECLRQFDDFDGRFAHSPYPDLISVHNMVVDTLYRAKAAIGAEGKHLDIDPRILRQTLLEDIEAYLQQGHDSYRKHFEIIDRDLREMPSSLSIRTRNLRRRAARNVRRFYTKLAGTHRRDRMIDGKGEDAQFTNIYEAAKYVWRNQI